jgi:hypothetical protein
MSILLIRFDPIWRLQRSATLALVLSPVGVLIIAAARLLIVAGYNPATASAIVASDGYVNTLLGSVLPVVPLLMPYVALVLLFFRRTLPGLLALGIAALVSPARYGRAAALATASHDSHQLVSLTGRNLWILVCIGVVIVLLVALQTDGLYASARTVGTFAAIALTIYVVHVFPLQASGNYYGNLLALPWMPAEKVTFTTGPPVVGYVLADSDLSLEVLVNSSRSVKFYRNDLVTGEQVCRLGAQMSGKPLVTLIPAKPAVQSCPHPTAAAPPAGTGAGNG